LTVGATVLAGHRRRARQAAAVRRANINLEREVRERKAKQAALLKEKRRAQQYLEVAEVIMMALDRSGRVCLINQKGCRVLGRAESEILGRDWFESFVPEGARGRAREHLSVLRAPDFIEYPVLGRGGEARMIAWHATLLDVEEGEPVTLYSGSDVTQVRELERQLRVSHKMDAIGTLAGGIAHDFNNLLTSILGYTAMSLQALPAEGEHVENLNQVYKAGLRAKGLINRILTFSRRGEQEVRPVRLSSVVDEVVKLLRSSLPSTVLIRTWIDPDCPPVKADANEIHQLLMNLCTNAFQAMEQKGGTLEVCLSELELSDEDCQAHPDLSCGPHAELVVTDTGCGMDPSTVDRVFEPFFTTKGVGKGTGLGLSVVHGIVKRHHGEISVASKLDEGTSFRVLLPCCDEEAEEEPAQDAQAGNGRESILFVDDEKPIVALGKRMLERLGYRVAACSSSTEALEAFRSDPGAFDLMITDRTMPEMTGVDLAEQILDIRPDLPVILASGGAQGNGSGHGIRHFIQKPFSLEEIDRVVRQALG
jgi:PAS domain S-box-containing protein